jgi:hypothetical protein
MGLDADFSAADCGGDGGDGARVRDAVAGRGVDCVWAVCLGDVDVARGSGSVLAVMTYGKD